MAIHQHTVKSNPVRISVVIPVYNAAEHLKACLEHLSRSSEPPWQTIVVDDGSTDHSAEVARSHGAILVTTGGRSGPARARNSGAQQAAGDVVFFLDADVCVQPDSTARVRRAFEEDPALDALIGSYDDSPGAPDFISQYKNLMHRFVHQNSRQEACSFWSGCGAIRREVFLEHSGFDESYGRPAIEDIELGFRLIQARRKIVLDKELAVKHLKRWTFWNLVKTDVMDRGVPWTELILRDRNMPNDLNLQLSQRVSVALAFICFGLAAAIAIVFRGYFLIPLFALLFFLLARYWLESAVEIGSRAALIWLTGGLGVLGWLAYSHRMIEIVPPLTLGYVLLLLRHRYAAKIGSKRLRLTTVAVALYLALTALFILTYLPGNILVGVFLLMLLVIVALNNQFFLFLAAKRGKLFAMAAVPFHLLYHFYNGISFIVGLARYAWRSALNPGEGQGRKA